MAKHKKKAAKSNASGGSGGSQANQQRILANYGPNTLAAKQALSPKLWKQQLALARTSGFTIESFFDKNTPNPLKERTKEGISKQAMDTINTAYAPSEQDLSSQDAKIRAIADKRSQDNKYYLDWLDNKSKEMQGASDAQAAALQAHQAQIQQDTATNYHDLRAQLVDQANARPGNVSNNAQATAFDTSPEAKRSQDTIAAQRTSTDNMIATAGSTAAATRANNVAVITAAQSKNLSSMYDALKDVGGEKIKLQLSKAADATKEIGRLLDQEIDKVRNNRDFSALTQKLDVQAAGVQASVTNANTRADTANADRAARVKTAKGQQSTSRANAKTSAATSRRNAGLSHADRVAARKQSAKDAAASRQTRRDIAAQSHSAGPGGLTAGQQNKNAQVANSTVSAIHTAQRIIHADKGTKAHHPISAAGRKALAKAGINSEDIIKIAYDLAMFGRLGPGAASIARRIFGPLTSDGKPPRL